MRLRGSALLVVGMLAVACKEGAKPVDADAAARADQTTRQLIAGLNAKNATVLAGLIVLTSTAGGTPRPLRSDELGRLAYPDGPFDYQGAGKPGTMVLTDGKKMKRVIRLIRVGADFKVLGSSEPYATYAARELGAAPGATLGDARVISIMTRN
jgi:hypothetical protein